MEFTTTERGARKLLKDGYIYLFKKALANEITSWEWELRRKRECRASVKLDELDNFVEQLMNTHIPLQQQSVKQLK